MSTLTIEMIEEAAALIKALAPREAPDHLWLINGITGLNIVKNEHMPSNTIMVSKDLFDKIYDASKSGSDQSK